ncbi:hypothetical protein [Streptomyces sp. URMC 123]|uniref:hypothetical protein n=1 Tax=Streptomyces sp. URMC 123 TaxID=3423403 RepID=UPI003F1B79CF
MTDESLRNEVVRELGEDRVAEIAQQLGTDAVTARQVITEAIAALPPDLRDDEGSPAAGAAGGGAGGGLGGLTTSVLSRVTAPTAKVVSRRTGLPEQRVVAALELLLPVTLTVIARRRRH